MNEPPEGQWSTSAGTVVAERYEIVRLLGRGEYGEVYEAEDMYFGPNRVAIKLFPGLCHSDRAGAKRFSNEVLSMARVEHPNVVRFFDVINFCHDIGYCMEFVDGISLAALGHDSEPFTIAEVQYLLREVCLGVEAIHNRGIVHRDLKPENVLLGRLAAVKIADFGLAHIIRQESAHIENKGGH